MTDEPRPAYERGMPLRVGEGLPGVEHTLARLRDRFNLDDTPPPTAAEQAAPFPSFEVERQRRAAEKVAGLWAMRCPWKFRGAALDDLDDSVAAGKVRSWAADLRAQHSNLVIAGPVGTGKTHAALAVARVANEVGLEWEFVPVLTLFRLLRPEGDRGAFDRFVSTDLLVLDELGMGKPSEWTVQELHALINDRWLQGRPVVATTNLPASALQEVLGEATYSRLVLDGAVTARLDGPDRRRGAK